MSKRRDTLMLRYPLPPSCENGSRGKALEQGQDFSSDWDVELADAETRAFVDEKPPAVFRAIVWMLIAAAALTGIIRMVLSSIH